MLVLKIRERTVSNEYKTFAGLFNSYNVLWTHTIVNTVDGREWKHKYIELKNCFKTSKNQKITRAYILSDKHGLKKIVGYSYHDMKYVSVSIQDAMCNDQLKKYL